MTSSVDQLLEAVRRDGPEGREAELTLGLLVERTVRGDDDIGREVLRTEWAEVRLTDAQVDTAVDALLDMLAGPGLPSTGVLWILGKAGDARSTTPLVTLVDRLLPDPAHAELTARALATLIAVAGDAERATVDAVVRRAAADGQGEARETAQDHLDARRAGPEAGVVDEG